MATVIDAFVVTFGLDPAQFQRGSKTIREESKKTREEARTDGKDIEARGRSAAQFLGNLKGQVLGVLAAFTAGAGLQQFAQNTLKTDAATGRLAKNLGLATEELSTWQALVRRVGGVDSDAESSLQSLVSAFQQIQLTGQSPLIPYLQTLGVSLSDLRDPTETLLKLSDAFKDMDPSRAVALGQGMGLSPAMINLLQKGRGELQKLIVEQQRLGVVTKHDAQEAQRLQATLSGLADGSRKLGRDMLTAAMPALEMVGRFLTDLTKWAQDNPAAVRGAVLGLATALGALALSMAAAAWPAVALIAALAAVGAAVGYLYDDFQKFQNGEASAIDWRPWLSTIAALQSALEGVGRALQAVAVAAGEATAAVPPETWEYLKTVFEGLARAIAFGLVGAINALANILRGVAGAIRLVVDLLRGDWSAAWRDAGEIGHTVLAGLIQSWRDFKKVAGEAWDAVRGKKSPEANNPRPKPKPAPGPAPANDNPTPSTFEGVRAYFRRQGWSEHASRGITAGANAESGLNPNALNPTSGAYGIGQWLGPRVKDFARVMGRPLRGSSMQQQLEFMQWEFNNTERRAGSRIFDAKNEHEALDAYVKKFMRPAPGEETRGDIARGTTTLAANAPAPAAPPPAPAAARPAPPLAPPPRTRNATPAEIRVVASPAPAGAGGAPRSATPTQTSQAMIEAARAKIAVATVPAGAAATAPPKLTHASTDARSYNETTIGQVNIHTAATDAPEIARTIAPALQKRGLVTQANRGLS